MADLNHRARKVLTAIVEEYLSTGEAVGSRTVTRRPGVEISPATVRNVMSDLEEAGLLAQPHSSAGRVPTTQGLRFFVDSLLRVRPLGMREREDLRGRYQITTGEVDTALREAGKVLSDLSQLTVVVSLPRLNHDVLEHLEFVRLPSGALLAVLVTRSGQVQNKLIHPGFVVGTEELERIHQFVHERLAGLTLQQVRERVTTELASERARYDQMMSHALVLSQAALSASQDGGTAMHVEGQARLLDQAGEVDVDKTRALFRALEEKQLILGLLEQTEQAEGLKVFIGAETNIEELADFSVVAASYGPESSPLGTLGVIGPNYMNYSKVIPLVDFTAELISGLVGPAGRR